MKETTMQSVLLGVAALACPVGMGLMMWMMMRGERRPDVSAAAAPVGGDQASQIDVLRAEIEQLKAERAARPAAGGL
jgi:hypothetical protein